MDRNGPIEMCRVQAVKEGAVRKMMWYKAPKAMLARTLNGDGLDGEDGSKAIGGVADGASKCCRPHMNPQGAKSIFPW